MRSSARCAAMFVAAGWRCRFGRAIVDGWVRIHTQIATPSSWAGDQRSERQALSQAATSVVSVLGGKRRWLMIYHGPFVGIAPQHTPDGLPASPTTTTPINSSTKAGKQFETLPTRLRTDGATWSRAIYSAAGWRSAGAPLAAAIAAGRFHSEAEHRQTVLLAHHTQDHSPVRSRPLHIWHWWARHGAGRRRTPVPKRRVRLAAPENFPIAGRDMAFSASAAPETSPMAPCCPHALVISPARLSASRKSTARRRRRALWGGRQVHCPNYY